MVHPRPPGRKGEWRPVSTSFQVHSSSSHRAPSLGEPPPSRKTWDKEAYTEKAKQKDAEYAERAKEREEAMKQGECGCVRACVS